MPSPEHQRVQVDIEQTGDVVTAVVSGEIDAASAESFENQLRSAVASTPSLSLDLSGVTFLDSSGLRALMTVHGEVTARDGGIELAASSSVVDRVLTVTGLVDQFTRPN